jgi:hypothetical protein
MGLILLILIVLLLVGGLPNWNYSRNWGYRPVSVLGVMLLVVVALLVFGVLPHRF